MSSITSRKRGLISAIASLAVAALVLAGCGGGSSTDSTGSGTSSGVKETKSSSPPFVAEINGHPFELADSIAQKLESGGELNYVMSITGTSIPIFSAAMEAGFDRAVTAANESTPVSGQIIGPTQQDIPTQVSQMRSLINAGQADCLIFNAVEPGPFVSVVDEAMAKGIPVFAVNADSPESERIAFYTINELKAGRQAGQIAAQQIKKQGIEVKKVALTTGEPAGPWAQERMKGFVAGLEAELPGVEFVNGPENPLPTTFEPQKVYSAVRSFITGNPEVNVIFSTDQGVEQISKVIADLHKTGEVYAVGFNLSPAIVAGIEEGNIITSIGQGWNEQAAEGANACTKFLLEGKIPKPAIQELPTEPVTIENAAEVGPSVEKGGA